MAKTPSARKIAVIPSAAAVAETSVETADDGTIADTPSQGEASSALTRLSVPLDADGRIDAARLREKTKTALRRAMADPGLSAALGVTPVAETADDAFALAMIAGAVYDGASALLVYLAARSGVPVERAAVLAFTAEEKRTLETPTMRVLAKYLPDIGGQYKDELVLALALTNIISGKVVLMRQSQTPLRADVAS